MGQLPWLCHLCHSGGRAAGLATTYDVACLLIALALASLPESLILSLCTIDHGMPHLAHHPARLASPCYRHSHCPVRRTSITITQGICRFSLRPTLPRLQHHLPTPAAFALHYLPHTPPLCLAWPQFAAFAHHPCAQRTTPATATTSVAVPLNMCAQVKRLGNVHACGHSPSRSLGGRGDCPVPPLK